MQRRAKEAKELALKKAAEQAAQAQTQSGTASAPPAATPSPAPVAALACPSCTKPIASDDLSRLFMGAMMGGRSGSGYLWSLGFGAAVLFLLGVTPGMLVGMKGAAIIHRAAIADLSLAETEQAMRDKLGEVQRRAKAVSYTHLTLPTIYSV